MRALRTAVALTAGALLGALLGATATVVPAAQAAAEGVVRPSLLTGEPVDGGDPDRPAALGVGDWLQRAGDDTDADPLRYTIEKTVAASTLRVSVVGQATSADMLTGRLALDLDGPDGGDCDSALGSGNARTPELLGAGVNAGPGLGCDGRAGTYALTVDVRSGDPLPLGIRVREEPAVDEVGFTDDRAPVAGDPYVTGPATDVVGGTSYADAPEIGAGRWAGEVRPGELLLYRLPLDFGESADVRVVFRPRGIGEGEQQRTYVGLVLSDPMRTPLVTAGGGESVETIDDPLTSAVPPVSRARTITGDVTGVADWTMAGDYHVAVSLGRADLSAPAVPSQPFRIHVAVAGEPADGPTYADGLTWSVADGARPGSGPGAAPDRGPARPRVAVVVAATGVVVVALLLLTGALVLRRRRRPRAVLSPR